MGRVKRRPRLAADRMNVLVDMNLAPRWVSLLADAGIEAAHGPTLGAANAPDTAIMAFAKANGHVVLTHDPDFSAILAATQGDKPSVAQIRAENVSPDVIGKPVIDALRQDRRAHGRRVADDRTARACCCSW